MDIAPLQARIRAAFPDDIVPAETPAKLLREEARNNEDALEMAAAFHGKRGSDVSARAIAWNRESFATFHPVAYRGYIGAILNASLTDSEVAGYLMFSLGDRPTATDERKAMTAARLDALDPAQREAIANVLQYFVDSYGDKGAAALLASWK